MTTASPFIFQACPLCGSAREAGTVRSIAKDMSLEGFTYVKCAGCGTYYERNVTREALDAFYRSLGPYESASAKDEIADDLARHLNLKGSERVLDLGCGSGAWSLPFLKHAGHLTCVDLDAGAVALLRQRVPSEHAGRVDCHASPTLDFLRATPAGTFDLVLSMFSLEHDLDPRAVLAGIARVLAPGGRAVILVPSGDALQISVLRGGYYWFQAPWHTFLPSEQGMRVAASAAALRFTGFFEPAAPFYSWFWMRGLADRSGARAVYERMRKQPWFVKADMALDKVFDRVSWRLGRPSYRFFVLEKLGT